MWFIYAVMCIVLITSMLLFLGTTSLHGYWDYAPDGEYHVLVCTSQVSNGSIFFPIDECCPTELHGSFRFMQNVTWLSDGWYRVKLCGNVIVDAWPV